MISTVAIFYLASLSLAFVVVAALVWIPADLRSMYRYRLWNLRDEVVDATLAGKLNPDATLVKAYSHIVESSIVCSRSISFVAHATRSRHSDEVRKKNRDWIARGLKELPHDQRRFMRIKFCEFNRAVSRQAFLGTPSGWIAIGVFGVVCLTIGIIFGILMSIKYGISNPVKYATRRCSRVAGEYACAMIVLADAANAQPLVLLRPQLAAIV